MSLWVAVCRCAARERRDIASYRGTRSHTEDAPHRPRSSPRSSLSASYWDNRWVTTTSAVPHLVRVRVKVRG